MRARFAVLAAVLVIASCARVPSSVPGAPPGPPDDQFETDGGLAYRVLIWTRTSNNERVVMYQTCGEGCFGCSSWHVERTLWPGSTTPIEATVAGRSRAPIPSGYGWR